MKKRLLACLLTAAMLTSLFPLSALAVEAEANTGDLCPHHQEHTEDCGFIEAVEGQPCGYVCPVCPVQALIDALPAPEDITADNRAEVEAQLAAIGEAWAELSEEEALQLNTARLEAAQDALDGQTGNNLPAPLAGTIDSIEYWDENGNKNTQNNVNLILADGCALNSPQGISVNDGNSLTIYAQSTVESEMGKLNVSGSDMNAGIGGDNKKDAGKITINGGYVTAIGGTSSSYGYGGAGIGDGGKGSGGEITINNGIIKEEGGVCAVAIGGGYDGAGGTITINDGTVTATGGRSSSGGSAGIGGGFGGAGGNIIITGGTVTATGHYDSSGIGNGGIGSGGTFSTDPNGNAFIIASPSISDTGNQGDWSGVIFEGDAGQVYGDSITLTTDAEIPSGKELTIKDGQTLTVDDGVILTNNGTINVESGGKLDGEVGGTVNRLPSSIENGPVTITDCGSGCSGHTITGTSTTNTITVASGTHNIILQDVRQK